MNAKLYSGQKPCLMLILLLVLSLATGCSVRGSSDKQSKEAPSAESVSTEAPKQLPLWAKAVSVPGGCLYFNKNTGEIYDCDDTVTEADIPAEIEGTRITAIGLGAFKNCTSLVRVSVPDSVTRIVSMAFENCTALTDVRLPGGLTAIEDDTFESCSSLTDIHLPDGLTTIGKAAFKDCKSLSDIVLPAGIRYIKNEAFSGCSSLEDITLPENLWTLEDHAFCGCCSLKSIVIPGRLSYIEDFVFQGCTSLDEVTIENGVAWIWNSAFANCSGLSRVFLPSSIENVELLAFDECENLMEFEVDEENEYYTAVSGVLFSKDLSELVIYPHGAFVRDTAYNLTLIPRDLRGENDDASMSHDSMLDPSVLKNESVHVVPLEQDGELNGALYCLLPESRRALSWQNADYALISVRSLKSRDDYVYEGTLDKALVFDATTTVYLCAPDGMFSEVFSVTKAPPDRGITGMSGEYASAEEIWESISDLF